MALLATSSVFMDNFKYWLAVFLLTIVLPVFGEGSAPAHLPAADIAIPTSEASRVEAQPLDSGCVIWDGRYIPPPYRIAVKGEQVFLNDRLAPPLRRPARSQGRTPRGGHKGGNNGPNSHTTSLQRLLENGGMLLVESGNAFMIRSDVAGGIVNTLFSDVADDAKISGLSQTMVDQMSENGVNWGAVVNSFVPDESLRDRFSHERPFVMEEMPVATISMRKKTMRYGMTVLGMVLGVLAFGMLLQHQPHVRAPRGEVDKDGDGFQLLPRYVLLVFLFAIFDLACTLFAHEAGGLLELNPLGSSIMHEPFLVGSLKIATAMGSSVILLRLRQYRVAQVASWWLCLVCVFLTLRWVTFNSMFLA